MIAVAKRWPLVRRMVGSVRAAALCAVILAPRLAVAADALRYGSMAPNDIGGPINLTDQTGHAFTLERIAGRPALLFFGFTHCGSTCPVALLTAAQLLRTPGLAAQFNLVFVTLDPLADGPAQLSEHLSRVDARIIGLTGKPDDIERTADRYGVGLRHSGNAIEHSSVWYLLDRAGQVARVYAHDTPHDQLAADVRQVAGGH